MAGGGSPNSDMDLSAIGINPADSPKSGHIFHNAARISIGGRDLLLFAPFGARVWSLLNLVICGFAVLFMICGIARAILQKKREFKNTDDFMNYSEEITQENKKKVTWLSISAAAGIFSVFLFLIFQDRSQPMVLIDFWTFTNATLLATEITAAGLAFRKSKKPTSSMTEIENNALPI